MKKTERTRELVQGPLDLACLQRRSDSGWRLVALEWEREVEIEPFAEEEIVEEVPYGLRVAGDCFHLEADPGEMQVLKTLAELIVQDVSFPRMAQSLNERAFRTREGRPWDVVSVFKLMPRLMEVAPRLLSSEEWAGRRRQLPLVAWNS